MNARVADIVYASLTLLAVTAAGTAKGYLDTLGEFAFVVAVSAVGLFVAHVWSHVLAKRLNGTINREWVTTELAAGSAMLVPAVILIASAAVVYLVEGTMELTATISMSVLTVLLFAYTWLGTRALLWSLGTAGVGLLMILFKVIV